MWIYIRRKVLTEFYSKPMKPLQCEITGEHRLLTLKEMLAMYCVQWSPPMGRSFVHPVFIYQFNHGWKKVTTAAKIILRRICG
jgi:hypothetical protein